jgi:hypothetical protein
MPVSIITNFTSNRFYPVNNHITATVNSPESGNCNFRYICDIYVNGIKVFTDKLFPDPLTGYGFFKIDRILQDYILDSLPSAPYSTITNSASSTTAPGAVLTVQCKFGQEYDSSSNCKGTVIQYLNQATSNTFYVFNGAIDYEDYPSWDHTKHLGVWASASYANKEFLTNSPREVEVTYNDSYFLDIYSLTNPITYVSPPNGFVAVEISKKEGNLTIATSSAVSSITGTPRRYRLAVGPYDLNKVFNTNYISQWTSEYKVRLVWRVGSSNIHALSETFTFKVRPPRPFQTRIGFIGRLGSIEHFTFYHRNNKSFDIVRSNYEKNMFSNTGGVWEYAVGDRGTSTYKVSSIEKHTVSSYVDKDWSQFLYEMWLSPEVWTYKRPELIEFKVYKETPSPTSRMLFTLPEGHGFKVGDQFRCFPDNKPNNVDYNNSFTITGVNGRTIDCGLIFAVYNLTESLCGWLHKIEDWKRLPIVISDNMVEVKQKVSKPIEYTLNYANAYCKTTLRP